VNPLLLAIPAAVVVSAALTVLIRASRRSARQRRQEARSILLAGMKGAGKAAWLNSLLRRAAAGEDVLLADVKLRDATALGRPGGNS
jgi:50S ribosomal subunit-associated GTPase HflX